jgi:hypothetical protein
VSSATATAANPTGGQCACGEYRPLVAEPLTALAIPGAAFADRLGADVMVGAETGGAHLSAAVSLAGDLPFAFVRTAGYLGRERRHRRALGSAAGRPSASRAASTTAWSTS